MIPPAQPARLPGSGRFADRRLLNFSSFPNSGLATHSWKLRFPIARNGVSKPAFPNRSLGTRVKGVAFERVMADANPQLPGRRWRLRFLPGADAQIPRRRANHPASRWGSLAEFPEPGFDETVNFGMLNYDR